MKNYAILGILLFAVIIGHAQSKPKVVASASMIYDIAYNIAGDKVALEMLVPIGGDPHLHEPTPSNAQQVNKADLILINGLTFEGWINELIANSGTDGKTIVVSEGVSVLSSVDYANSVDPHAWMIATNGIIYAENIAKALQELLPSEGDYFADRLEIYRQKLLELHQYILDEVATIPEQSRIVITTHDAFQYFGKGYGLQLEAIMGISTEAEAQTSDISRIISNIKKYNIPAVFIESTINPKMMKQIAKDNDVIIGGELFADSLGDEESGASTYIDMLKYNTDIIVAGLTNSEPIDSETDENNYTMYVLLFLALGTISGYGIWKLNK